MFSEIFFTYVPLLALAGGGYLLWRYVRANEKRKTGSSRVNALEDRVAELEDQLSTTTSDLERLEEGQGFTERLLSERRKGPGAS
jgi:hypothetical protein